MLKVDTFDVFLKNLDPLVEGLSDIPLVKTPTGSNIHTAGEFYQKHKELLNSGWKENKRNFSNSGSDTLEHVYYKHPGTNKQCRIIIGHNN